MECFQGYYRDRIDGGWECRYFSAVYPALRVLTYIVYSLTLNKSFNSLFLFLCIGVISLQIIMQPYKSPNKLYNKVDIFLVMSLLGLLFGSVDDKISNVSYIINRNIISSIYGIVPLIYFAIKVMHHIILCFVRNLTSVCSGEVQRKHYQLIL